MYFASPCPLGLVSFIYFSLITVYQILEEVGNLVMYNNDKSWHDIEGYVLGFSYYVFYLVMKNKQREDSMGIEL